MHKIYRFNEDRKDFGNNLKELMKKNNYTIEKLAEEINITDNTIKKWRSGERIPNIDMLYELAKILNTSMHQLYLPNSIFCAEFSDDVELFFNNRISLLDLKETDIQKMSDYFEYLLQKMLFSFLSINEKNKLEKLFSCCKISIYGKRELNVQDDITFDIFYNNSRKYILNKYGKCIPYTIDREISDEICNNYDRIIKFIKGR